MDILQRAQTIAPDLVELRRDFHKHPETAFREHRTATIVAERLEELGYTVRRGVGRTGVTAELGDGAEPVVALRADMDALPIQEEGEHGYRSTVPGVMHACGHDAHTAGLLGTARLLVDLRVAGALPPGRVRLLFQPSEESTDEEGKSGATRMMEDGAMEGVAAVAGLHVGGHLPSGKVFVKEGPLMAGSDDVRVEVLGRSSHAALPHEGVDALVLAAQGILAAQTVVSRRLSPMENGVVTFGTVEGGAAPNVVPERIVLKGTVRYFNPDIRERLLDGVREAFRSLEAQGGEVRMEVTPGYPPLVNHRESTEVARRVATELVGQDGVWKAEPMMGAEDFAILAGAAPGVFLWLGAALPDPREHHHPRFDIDESVLPLGAALLAGIGRDLLHRCGEGDL